MEQPKLERRDLRIAGLCVRSLRVGLASVVLVVGRARLVIGAALYARL